MSIIILRIIFLLIIASDVSPINNNLSSIDILNRIDVILIKNNFINKYKILIAKSFYNYKYN